MRKLSGGLLTQQLVEQSTGSTHKVIHDLITRDLVTSLFVKNAINDAQKNLWHETKQSPSQAVLFTSLIAALFWSVASIVYAEEPPPLGDPPGGRPDLS